MKERTSLHRSKGKGVLLAKFQPTNLPMCERETKAFSAPRKKLRKCYTANVIGQWRMILLKLVVKLSEIIHVILALER